MNVKVEGERDVESVRLSYLLLGFRFRFWLNVARFVLSGVGWVGCGCDYDGDGGCGGDRGYDHRFFSCWV